MRKRSLRLLALIQKELIQTLRDRRTVAIILALPLIELFLFTYAVKLTVDHLPTVVADLSRDRESRAFLSALTESGYFDLVAYVDGEAEVIAALDANRARVGVIIPPHFAVDLGRNSAQALVLLDGSESFSVGSGYSAAVAVAQQYALRLAAAQAQRMGITLAETPITTSTRVLYNPDLNDLIFILPGLVAMLLQLMATLTTAQSVVREYELGTIEQLLVTPARPLELMIAKLVPNALLMVVIAVLTTGAGVFWFGVPFRGSPWLYAWLVLLFVWSGLGLGLLVSSVSSTQREAQQITMMITMLSMLLTGFIFPRTPMPQIIRLIGNMIPLTYFVRISRGIITKGVGLEFLWSDVLALLIYGVVILIFAARSARQRLD